MLTSHVSHVMLHQDHDTSGFFAGEPRKDEKTGAAGGLEDDTDDPAAPGTAPEDCPTHDAALEADVPLPEAEEEQAAEAEPEAPAIPAEMLSTVKLPRQADRSAVVAPSDALGDFPAM